MVKEFHPYSKRQEPMDKTNLLNLKKDSKDSFQPWAIGLFQDFPYLFLCGSREQA